MKAGFVGIHYPHLAHRDEFLSRVQRAVDLMRPTPGCLSAECWTTAAGDAVVSTGQWDTEDAMASSFATAKAAGVDFDYDERESRPREVLRLVSAVNSTPSERHTPEPAVQCHTVLVDLFGALDRGQATQALELFTPDASIEADGKQLHGHDEIASFLAQAQGQDRPTAHLITNEVVRRATEDEIELTALLFLHEPQADGKYRLERVLDTVQAFRCTRDGWRIHRRTSTPLHPRPTPAGG